MSHPLPVQTLPYSQANRDPFAGFTRPMCVLAIATGALQLIASSARLWPGARFMFSTRYDARTILYLAIEALLNLAAIGLIVAAIWLFTRRRRAPMLLLIAAVAFACLTLFQQGWDVYDSLTSRALGRPSTIPWGYRIMRLVEILRSLLVAILVTWFAIRLRAVAHAHENSMP